MEEIFLKDTCYKIRFDILTDLYGKYRKLIKTVLIQKKFCHSRFGLYQRGAH